MREEPIERDGHLEAEPFSGQESRLERWIVRAVRLALLVYLLPALVVTLIITWAALIGWKAVLLVEATVRWFLGLPRPSAARKPPAPRRGIPSWSHLRAQIPAAPAPAESTLCREPSVVPSERVP
jgi:hypothetical protein